MTAQLCIPSFNNIHEYSGNFNSIDIYTNWCIIIPFFLDEQLTMTDQNTNGGWPRSANGFIDMVVVGNAGSDPEMRYTPSGTAVTNFSLAINVRVPRDGE
jgi:hypothetical protein